MSTLLKRLSGRESEASASELDGAAATKPYWIKDSSVTACYECESQFSFTLRKHHCRACGRVFCSTCTRRLPPQGRGRKGKRVCTFCYSEQFGLPATFDADVTAQAGNNTSAAAEPTEHKVEPATPSASSASNEQQHAQSQAQAHASQQLHSQSQQQQLAVARDHDDVERHDDALSSSSHAVHPPDETVSPYFANTPLYATADERAFVLNTTDSAESAQAVTAEHEASAAPSVTSANSSNDDVNPAPSSPSRKPPTTTPAFGTPVDSFANGDRPPSPLSVISTDDGQKLPKSALEDQDPGADEPPVSLANQSSKALKDQGTKHENDMDESQMMSQHHNISKEQSQQKKLQKSLHANRSENVPNDAEREGGVAPESTARNENTLASMPTSPPCGHRTRRDRSGVGGPGDEHDATASDEAHSKASPSDRGSGTFCSSESQQHFDTEVGTVPLPSSSGGSPGEGRTHHKHSYRPRRSAPSDSLAAPVPDDVLDRGSDIWWPPQDCPQDKAAALAASLREKAENISATHLRCFADMQLRAESVRNCNEWASIVARLAHEAGKSVSPSKASAWRAAQADSPNEAAYASWSGNDTSLSTMDVMQHVKIKRIAARKAEHSTVVKGVVCHKNVAHRRMPQWKDNCRVAVIRGALEYQRSEGRLSSLDTLLEQEREHLRIGVTRIQACNPDVVLVERTVARQAQELLLEAGISLVLNVKSTLLERICRCTGAQKASAFDLAKEHLGYCGRFRVEYVQQEHPIFGVSWPLMFFEECNPAFGATVLLYGEQWDVIRSVKSVLRAAIKQARHLLLESAYLADELATEYQCCSHAYEVLHNALESSAKNVWQSNFEAVQESCASSSPHIKVTDLSHSPLPQRLDGAQSLIQHQQRLLVSIASRNIKTSMLCEPHTVRRVEHYGPTDMPLGSFMEAALPGRGRFCVNSGCGYKPEAHIRTYLHGKGRIALRVRQAPREIKASARNSNGMWIWSRCMRCDKLAAQGDDRAKKLQAARRKVLLSEDAKAVSFGRFLELMLAGSELYAACGHSLHRDHVRFLACEQGVACLQYQAVVPLAVHIPDTRLSIDVKSQRDHMDKERSNLMEETRQLFASIERNLKSLWRWELFSAGVSEDRSDEASQSSEGRRRYDEQLSALGQERDDFMQHLMDETHQPNVQDISIGQVNRLRQGVMETSRRWSKRVHELHHHRRFAVGQNAQTNGQKRNQQHSSSQSQQYLQMQTRPAKLVTEESSKFAKANAEDTSSASRGKEMVGSASTHSQSRVKSSNDSMDSEYACSRDAHPQSNSYASQASHQQHHLPYQHNALGRGNAKEGASSLRGINLWRMSSASSFSFGHNGSESSTRPASPVSSRQKTGENDRASTPQLGVWTPSGRSHMRGDGSEAEDSVVVYDDEPTTMVAMALQSEEFKKQLRSHNSHLGNVEQANGRDRERNGKRTSYADVTSVDGERPEIGAGPELCHVKHTFELDSAQSDVKAKYSVTAYYAAQFRSLRERLLGGDDPFIASLCRSRKWDTNGGKSNAYFAKTLDDRFVVKQLSRTELSSFLEFGPAYFKYMASALQKESPTVLAKLVGVFNVVLRVPKQNGSYREDRLNFVVQENLFYGRTISSVYDLKGSLRSRYNDAKDTGVLLDENLVETLSRAPLLVQQKSKQQLERAVWNDSAFLASLGVMDYSLLVGIDEERCELVVGLIDFVRQYTWDKQLETYVKQSGMFGGGGKEPTIVSPKQYKKRFCNAMSSYFVLVPEVQSRSHWIYDNATDGANDDADIEQHAEEATVAGSKQSTEASSRHSAQNHA